MSAKPKQLTGGALRGGGGSAEVRPVEQTSRLLAPQAGGNVSPSQNSDASGGKSRRKNRDSRAYIDSSVQEFFSIPDLANRWRVSRSAVYVFLRGWPVVDFAPAPGRKGHKLVSAETVRQIERERLRVMR